MVTIRQSGDAGLLPSSDLLASQLRSGENGDASLGKFCRDRVGSRSRSANSRKASGTSRRPSSSTEPLADGVPAEPVAHPIHGLVGPQRRRRVARPGRLPHRRARAAIRAAAAAAPRGGSPQWRSEIVSSPGMLAEDAPHQSSAISVMIPVAATGTSSDSARVTDPHVREPHPHRDRSPRQRLVPQARADPIGEVAQGRLVPWPLPACAPAPIERRPSGCDGVSRSRAGRC